MASSEGSFDRTVTNVKVVYWLYLASLLVGITSLIGVIIAYVNRGTGNDWLDSHYSYQFRTFWIGVLYAIIGLAFSLTNWSIALLLGPMWCIWWIVRCVKGLQLTHARERIVRPRAWIW